MQQRTMNPSESATGTGPRMSLHGHGHCEPATGRPTTRPMLDRFTMHRCLDCDAHALDAEDVAHDYRCPRNEELLHRLTVVPVRAEPAFHSPDDHVEPGRDVGYALNRPGLRAWPR